MLVVLAGTAILLPGAASIALARSRTAIGRTAIGRLANRSSSWPTAYAGGKSKSKCKPHKHTTRGTRDRCSVQPPKPSRKEASCEQPKRPKRSEAKRQSKRSRRKAPKRSAAKGKPKRSDAKARCAKPRATAKAPTAAAPAPVGNMAPVSSPAGPPPSSSVGQPAVGMPEVVGFGPLKELTTPTETILEADIDPEGNDVKYHFEYGLTTSYGANAPTPEGDTGAGFVPAEVSVKITGLTPRTTYHERIVAEFAGSVYDGPDFTFTTAPWEPALEGYVAVVNVSSTEATLRGAVYPGYAATTADFEYGETTALGSSTTEDSLGADNTRIPIEYTLKGLKSSTSYDFRLEATNSIGTAHGIEYTLTTSS